MVEHSVHHHFDISVMGFLYKTLKIIVVTQPAVCLFIILCIITVSGRFEQRSDIDG